MHLIHHLDEPSLGPEGGLGVVGECRTRKSAGTAEQVRLPSVRVPPQLAALVDKLKDASHVLLPEPIGSPHG